MIWKEFHQIQKRISPVIYGHSQKETAQFDFEWRNLVSETGQISSSEDELKAGTEAWDDNTINGDGWKHNR